MENPSVYSDGVWCRFIEPRCAGEFDAGGENILVGEARDAASGQVVKLSLLVETDVVVEARFKALGCPTTIAVASLFAETLAGKKIDALREVSGKVLAETLEVPAEKLACGLLVEDALQAALQSHGQAR